VLIYNAAKIGPGTLPGQPLHTVINKLAEDGVRISACLPAQWAEGDPVQDRPILTIVPVRSPTSADDPQPWREGLEVPAFYFSK
jgi:hypothetical protein